MHVRSHADLRNLQRAVGDKIAAHWISTRDSEPSKSRRQLKRGGEIVCWSAEGR